MRYLRTYPWWLQFTLFLLMVFTFLSFGFWCVGMILPKATGYTFEVVSQISDKSPYDQIRYFLIVTGALSVSMYMIPSLLFSYLATPTPKQYNGLKAPKKWWHLILGVVIMLSALPLLDLIQQLVGNINFSNEVKAQQEIAEKTTKAMLSAPTLQDLALTLLVMGIIPGLGEELFFRGMIMRFSTRSSKSLFFGIALSSAVFAFVHSNIYGMFSIFLAGALLGSIYYFTGSLWCSIIAHILFNSNQVLLNYWSSHSTNAPAFINSTHLDWKIIAISTIIFAASLFLLYRTKRPLADNWTDDFATS